jgi:hypothetical protein
MASRRHGSCVKSVSDSIVEKRSEEFLEVVPSVRELSSPGQESLLQLVPHLGLSDLLILLTLTLPWLKLRSVCRNLRDKNFDKSRYSSLSADGCFDLPEQSFSILLLIESIMKVTVLHGMNTGRVKVG